MTFATTKTVYGPVESWRFGHSLGIDPIFTTSSCSFNCIYCQLGHIQNITMQREVYVTTKRVIDDFKDLYKRKPRIDVITFSGSGEPTLALNLKEIAEEIKDYAYGYPLYILTNGTTLHDSQLRDDLNIFDHVIVKLDAGDNKHFQKINRPHHSITFEKLIDSIVQFREKFLGKLEIQCMFMPSDLDEVIKISKILKVIHPDTVQINTPTRPYPLSWHRENRGNHLKIFDHRVRDLKVLTAEESAKLITLMKEMTGLHIIGHESKKKGTL